MDMTAEAGVGVPAAQQEGPTPTAAPMDGLERGGGEQVEVPRPALTLRQAAALLGKSLRALERSLLGKWGNRLPEGWTARKVPAADGYEWRIMPPPGFRLRQTSPAGEEAATTAAAGEEGTASPAGLLPHSLRRSPAFHSLDQPAIVIDRSDEVERLLRDLLETQRQLSEERRLRMEDMRLISQMQGSMRLLESRANDTALLKEELSKAREELLALKEQYLSLRNLPWWRRIFVGS